VRSKQPQAYTHTLSDESEHSYTYIIILSPVFVLPLTAVMMKFRSCLLIFQLLYADHVSSLVPFNNQKCHTKGIIERERVSGLRSTSHPRAFLARTSASASLNIAHGGAQQVKALKDFSAVAAGYFSGIRGPASFLAGGALGALFLFAGKSKIEELKSQTRLENLLFNGYHLSMMMAYTFSLATIVVSTAAVVTVLHGQFDPMAETAYMLLKREFEFEYLTCRWSFLVALFSFLVGVTSRAVIEFDMLNESKRSSLKFVTLSLLALCCHLMSYINHTLYCYPNFLIMTICYFKVRMYTFFPSFFCDPTPCKPT
jgi:hypothetical protein